MKILIPTRAGTIKAKSFLKVGGKEAIQAATLVTQIEDPELRNKVRDMLIISLLINKGIKSPIYIEAIYCLTHEERVKVAKDWIKFSDAQERFRVELNQTEYIPF